MKLMKREEFLDILVELIICYDGDGRVLGCNQTAREKLGYEGEERPALIFDVLPNLFQRGTNVALPVKQGEYLETDMYRLNQTCFPAELRFGKIRDGLYLCAGQDMTKHRELERRMNQTQEEIMETMRYKSEFVSNITHELRTPVNGMMGLTQGLLETSLTPAQLESVQIIERCCANMTKIINDLLDFSKLEFGKLELEDKPFIFRDFLNKAMAFNVNAVNEKGLKLILRVDDEIPKCLSGDELRLTQILNNLISNAVKFTSVGHIALEISQTMETEDTVELFFMVMDTGIGIAKEDMDKLFRSFSQVDASITRRFGGTGLGLAICRQLVEMMGGRIHVESEEGKGSSFSFHVNLKKVPDQQEMAGESDVDFPSGKFVYEGSGRFQTDGESERSRAWTLDTDRNDVYYFGTKANLKEIRSNMEKLLICLELENWMKAENFAGAVKGLISAEHKELKKEAFRLELMVRRENKSQSMEQYEVVKQMIAEVEENESDEES